MEKKYADFFFLVRLRNLLWRKNWKKLVKIYLLKKLTSLKRRNTSTIENDRSLKKRN